MKDIKKGVKEKKKKAISRRQYENEKKGKSEEIDEENIRR